MRTSAGNFEVRVVYLKRLVCLLLVVAFPAVAQETAPSENGSQSTEFKVATVDIQALFKDYRKTLIAEREIDLARAEIQKGSQQATNMIQARKRAAEKKILNLQEGEASEEEIEDMKRELPILRRELQEAERNKQQERDVANQKLNKQMVRRMSGILEEIRKLTAQKAEVEGFDLVVDSSGHSSNQVPPLLFIGNATDITEMMRKEFSKSSAIGR